MIATVERPAGRPLRVGVIGARGFNAQHRLLPALAAGGGRLDVVGYDRADGPAREFGFRVERVGRDADLAARLAAHSPDVVFVETPDSCHPNHVRLALAAGARLVLCEKLIAPDAAAGAAVRDACAAAAPGQTVRYVDHYLMIDPVRALAASAADWLGTVESVQVELLEPAELPASQVVSHAGGMANFFHHVVAIAGLWFDTARLEPVAAGWDRYPGAPVPDTFRWAAFRDTETGRVVSRGSVGKGMGLSRKWVWVAGSRGRALIDRDRNVLEVTSGDARFTVPGTAGDTGYPALVAALAAGTPLPPLLTPDAALTVLQLVERAHADAVRVAVYRRATREAVAPVLPAGAPA